MLAGRNCAFDLDEALSIADGDRALLRELVDVFRSSYPGELASIQDAIRTGDAEALRVASHQLKGALGALAAGPARETALQLEQIGRVADLSGAAAVYEEMERQVRALDAALSAWG